MNVNLASKSHFNSNTHYFPDLGMWCSRLSVYCFVVLPWSYFHLLFSPDGMIFIHGSDFFSHPHTVRSIWFKIRNCFQYSLTISITLFPYRMFSFLYMLVTDEVYNYVGGRQSIAIFKGRYIYWVIGCRRSNHLFRSSRRQVSTKLTKMLINKP